MHLGESASKKTAQRIRLVLVIIAGLFTLAFWKEIIDVIQLLWVVFSTLLLRFPYKGVDPYMGSFQIILFNCLVGFGLVFLLWLFLISAQALLPVSNLVEVWRTMWHLWLYIIRQHGQAVHIRDGEKVLTQEDLKRRGHGVIVVDFNSAVVLEERDQPPGFSRLFNRISLFVLHLLNLSDAPVASRVCGPGIVFTLPGERIHGVVDLRKQFRMQKNIPCYTREGIELNANVFSLFTIGADPETDALEIVIVDDPSHPPIENIRVCNLSTVPGRGGRFLRVNSLQANELDEDDALEILRIAAQVNTDNLWFEYTPRPPATIVPVFNEARVFSAIFAQAQRQDEDIMPWTDLPTRVAANFYREILLTINYDDLYNINGQNFPLNDHKARLRRRMRNNGLLSFRLVKLRSGQSIAEKQLYHETALQVSHIYPLTSHKLLRDRGIKVMFSSFGELNPVSPMIYQQRLENWRAKWESELDITHATRDLQAMRIRSRALAAAQHDLWYSLNQLFTAGEYTNEALAVRIIQALENAATDPTTHELLPRATIETLRHINTLLLHPGGPSGPAPSSGAAPALPTSTGPGGSI